MVRDRVDLCREEVDSLERGARQEESWRDRCLDPGDSAGVVSADDWMGERGRKSRNLGRR